MTIEMKATFGIVEVFVSVAIASFLWPIGHALGEATYRMVKKQLWKLKK